MDNKDTNQQNQNIQGVTQSGSFAIPQNPDNNQQGQDVLNQVQQQQGQSQYNPDVNQQFAQPQLQNPTQPQGTQEQQNVQFTQPDLNVQPETIDDAYNLNSIQSSGSSDSGKKNLILVFMGFVVLFFFIIGGIIIWYVLQNQSNTGSNQVQPQEPQEQQPQPTTVTQDTPTVPPPTVTIQAAISAAEEQSKTEESVIDDPSEPYIRIDGPETAQVDQEVTLSIVANSQGINVSGYDILMTLEEDEYEIVQAIPPSKDFQIFEHNRNSYYSVTGIKRLDLGAIAFEDTEILRITLLPKQPGELLFNIIQERGLEKTQFTEDKDFTDDEVASEELSVNQFVPQIQSLTLEIQE